MDVRVLGTVEVGTNGTWIPIEGPKERALVATLALEAGRNVPHARLVEALWGDAPPDTADKMLQWHVSRLRKAIGHGAVATTPSGYSLTVDAGNVDALEFVRLTDEGSALVHEQRYAKAIDHLTEALAMWRGAPFQDLADSAFRTGQQRRFEELHELARERWIECHIGLGHADVMVAELESVIAEHPYREGPWMALILALYRCGRQADALRTYQRFRRRLVEDLGIEPSGAIRHLEEQILRQDPVLDARRPKEDADDAMAPASPHVPRPATKGVGTHR
jgi:DNA-binding SARP family transcriptional activator